MIAGLKWGKPILVKENYTKYYMREVKIPPYLVSSFFEFWKKNKDDLMTRGFRVTKKRNYWYVQEVQEKRSDFNKKKKKVDFTTKPPKPYKLKKRTKLRKWQIPAAEKLIASIKEYTCAIDGSDMGLGKTYTACAVARELNFKIFVVCPNAVKESWKRVINDHFKIKSLTVISYELLRRGKTEYCKEIRNRSTRQKEFIWKIPKENTLIVWDEAQKLKNPESKQSKLAQSANAANYKMLFCSATIATSPLQLKTVGNCLGFFSNNHQYRNWIIEHGAVKEQYGYVFHKSDKALKKLNIDLFTNRGVRLKRELIEDFPETEIICQPYNLDDASTREISKIYKEMHDELKELDNKIQKTRNKKRKSDYQEIAIVKQLRARQRIELLKIPLFIELIEDGLENGMSIPVFLNFTDSIKAISERFNTDCIVSGTVKDKQYNIDKFQNDQERIIVVQTAAGGAGLSLHDVTGKYPRYSLISPSYSAEQMRQVSGRVWRDGGKTKSIQKLIYVANTIEEHVCENMSKKLDNLDLLNDGDLTYDGRYEF